MKRHIQALRSPSSRFPLQCFPLHLKAIPKSISTSIGFSLHASNLFAHFPSSFPIHQSLKSHKSQSKISFLSTIRVIPSHQNHQNALFSAIPSVITKIIPLYPKIINLIIFPSPREDQNNLHHHPHPSKSTKKIKVTSFPLHKFTQNNPSLLYPPSI